MLSISLLLMLEYVHHCNSIIMIAVYFQLIEPTPVDVYLTDIDIQRANVSWNPLSPPSSLMIEDVNPVYTLTVTSSNTPPQILQLHQPYYVFIAPGGAPPCEVYNFSVTATYVGASYTGAGCSVPSSTISRMLPSLPDIVRLNSSHTYSIVLIRGDLKLNVTFEVCIIIRNVTIEIICY